MKARGQPQTCKITPIAVAATLMILSFAAGYLTGFKQAENAKTAAIQATKEEMRDTLAKTGALPATPEIRQIHGKITAVNAESLEIEADQVVTNPLEEPAPVRRRVLIADDTQIVRTETKTPEQYGKELAAFQKAQQAAAANMEKGLPTATGTPPSPETTVDIGLSDLRAGDFVEIAAAEDIARATEFRATVIKLQPLSATGTPESIGADASAEEPPGLSEPSMSPISDPSAH